MTRRWGAPLTIAASVGVVVASFLPMVRTGSAARQSYQVVAAAERLEVVTGVMAGVARGWYLVPLVAVGAWLATLLGARTTALVACVMLCVATVSLYVVTRQSSLTVLPAAFLLPVLGALAPVGAVRQIWEHRQHGPPTDLGRSRSGDRPDPSGLQRP